MSAMGKRKAAKADIAAHMRKIAQAKSQHQANGHVDETEAADAALAADAAVMTGATAVADGAKATDAEVTEGATETADAVTASDASEYAALPPVLIVAAEAAPLAKTGGLADVVGALPKYLRRLGVDARVMMPFHRQIKDRYASEATHLFDYWASPVWSDRFVGVDRLDIDGVPFYFIDNEYYFGHSIYAGDNFEGEQYGFFMQAVCDVLPNLDFDPGIVHCNDWHTAMIPFKLKAKAHRMWTPTPKTLLTIHNLAYQGTYGDDLDARLIGDDERAYAWDLGCWNMMKAGIDTADRVNTVSPTYAREITTPEFGEGLEWDLRHIMGEGRLTGILNGIEDEVWDPETDPHLAANYSVGDMAGKRACKQALEEELGLDVDPKAPLIAMISRLTPQKGISLAKDAIESLAGEDVRFVILGSGYPELEGMLRDLEMRNRGRVCSYIGYNNELSHRIYAASDFFLMPSAFEPCGISQMIAMRYGSLPIVHETGGLKDTVQPYNEYTGEGTGFSFSKFDSWDCVEAVRRALDVYRRQGIMSQLIRNAMMRDFGFMRCAQSYAGLYRAMV